MGMRKLCKFKTRNTVVGNFVRIIMFTVNCLLNFKFENRTSVRVGEILLVFTGTLHVFTDTLHVFTGILHVFTGTPFHLYVLLPSYLKHGICTFSRKMTSFRRFETLLCFRLELVLRLVLGILRKYVFG